MAKNKIVTFTKSGKPVDMTPSGIKPAHLGTKTEDGTVYQHPRLKLDTLSGPRVKVTNPQASLTGPRNKRTAGLGMGAANTAMQRGRTRDL